MKPEFFKKLVDSVKQMGSIMQGEKIPHRKVVLSDIDVKGLREKNKKGRNN